MKKFVLIFILVSLTASCQKKIQIHDAIVDNTLQIPENPLLGNRDRAYILNTDYAIFQKKDSTRKIFKVDSKSFRYPRYDGTNYFALDKNGVYFQGNIVEIDTTGFKIVGEFRNNENIKERAIVWKTNSKLFINETEINKEIDVPSFRTATYSTDYYFKDKNHIYYKDQRILGSDASSASESFDNIIYDKRFVYVDGKIGLYKGDTLKPVNHYLIKTNKVVLTLKNFIVQHEMDAKTIKPLSRYFSVDKNYIYFQNQKMPVKPEHFKNVKVFDQTNSAYLTDGNKVYKVYNDSFEEKPGLDAKTFGMFHITDYYYDKNGVYGWVWFEKESKGVVKKFPFKYDEFVSKSNTYITNSSNRYVFYKNQASDGITLFENLTPEQTQVAKSEKKVLVELGYSYRLATLLEYRLYKTEDKIYWKDMETDADAPTFERVYSNYFKDKNYLYQYDRDKGLIIINNIDVKSLSTFNDFLSDKNYIYANNYRILKNKKVELLAVIAGYFPGCGSDTTPSSTYYLVKNVDGYWIVLVSNDVKIKHIGLELEKRLKKFETN